MISWSHCPICHTSNRPAAHFCISCGQTLGRSRLLNQAQSKFCLRCGQPIRPGARFCLNCGALTAAATAEASPIAAAVKASLGLSPGLSPWLSPRLSCPHCGQEVRPSARFCWHCRAPLKEICPHCGGDNRLGARFCGHCRAHLKAICPHCGQTNRLGARYCGHCRNPLAEYPQPVFVQIGVGSVLEGRFRLVAKVAEGGQGTVYQAFDLQKPQQAWAVKELSLSKVHPDERQSVIAAFMGEAELLRRLNHPNLPRVLNVFTEPGDPQNSQGRNRYFMVMEWVEGETLEKINLTSPVFLDEKRVLLWAVQICDVLGYLHGQKPPIIYRDLKPSNLMEDRNSGLLKVIDFGIARLHKTGKKRDTVAMGSPGFAPPEQYGKAQTDSRSDVYALGVTLHNLLTKQDPSQLATAFLLPAARKLNPAVSEETENAIIKATRVNQNDRFQTIDEFRRALPLAKFSLGATHSARQFAT
ncbi:MAG: hypothetical protein EXR62_06805 [Chloroflexi bacterium]|nr:hypothetical protein [Chloroflexota bacterium]